MEHSKTQTSTKRIRRRINLFSRSKSIAKYIRVKNTSLSARPIDIARILEGTYINTVADEDLGFLIGSLCSRR